MSAAAPAFLETNTGIDQLTIRRNSLGSEYIAFQADESTILNLARLPLEQAFRRVVLDPVRGLVVLMSPSRTHEALARDVDTFVKAAADEFDISNSTLGATRWRGANDPQNTGNEPDCCYYLGENARAYRQARARGEDAADAFAFAHPPDLVVEVGVAHIDHSKQARYRELGVPEYWQVNEDKSPEKSISVSFLALQYPDSRELTVSNVLPGLRNKDVTAGLLALRDPQLDSDAADRDAITRIIRKRKGDSVIV